MPTTTRTTTPVPAGPAEAPAGCPDVGADQVVTIRCDAPDALDRYLAMVGDHAGPRIKFLDGSLTLVSPARKHERSNDRIDAVIKAIGAVFEVAYYATASTLYRRGNRAGIEPDRSYYIAHCEAVEALDEDEPINLDTYPPPDLVVEVVHTHGASQALAVCALLGVPEVWVYHTRRPALEVRRARRGRPVCPVGDEPIVPLPDAGRRPPLGRPAPGRAGLPLGAPAAGLGAAMCSGPAGPAADGRPTRDWRGGLRGAGPPPLDRL